MPTWNVTLPFAGSILTTVEADSAEAAIDKAMDLPFGLEIDGEAKDKVYIGEWELMRELVTGNVCYAPCWKAEADRDTTADVEEED